MKNKATGKQLIECGKKIHKLRAELRKLEAESARINANLPSDQRWTVGQPSAEAGDIILTPAERKVFIKVAQRVVRKAQESARNEKP